MKKMCCASLQNADDMLALIISIRNPDILLAPEHCLLAPRKKKSNFLSHKARRSHLPSWALCGTNPRMWDSRWEFFRL